MPVLRIYLREPVMSFHDNVIRPSVRVLPDQCEMTDPHHPDCECASCRLSRDVMCLELAVGIAPDSHGRVCRSCAKQVESEDFVVDYFPERKFRIWFRHVSETLDPTTELPWWTGPGISAQAVAESIVPRYAEYDGCPQGTIDLIIHDTTLNRWHEMTFNNKGWKINHHQVGDITICDRSTK